MSILESAASRLGAAWNTANATQRALVVGGVVAGILSLVLVFSWTSQPDMMVLFSGLEAEEASGILQELDELTVPYDLAANGSTVRVPADRVGELRIRLAGKGLTGSSTIGYEIFDRSNLGMTEFLQQVNYRRALEGELTRTIVSAGRSEERAGAPGDSRKRDVFSREPVRSPKASVIIDLLPGSDVSAPDQVRGIYALIAASVEGHAAERRHARRLLRSSARRGTWLGRVRRHDRAAHASSRMSRIASRREGHARCSNRVVGPRERDHPGSCQSRLRAGGALGRELRPRHRRDPERADASTGSGIRRETRRRPPSRTTRSTRRSRAS